MAGQETQPRGESGSTDRGNKYPDTIDGEITINSSNTPVRLVATANGQMTLLVKPS